MENIIYKAAQDCVNLEVSKVRCYTLQKSGDGDCAFHAEHSLIQEFPTNLYRCPEIISEMVCRAVTRRGCSATVSIQWEQFLSGYTEPWWYCYATIYPIFVFNDDEWVCIGSNKENFKFQRISTIEIYDRPVDDEDYWEE